ncbi:MAG: hypothetical protein JXB60_02410 [Candidatus Cloacimonetes bacterium]|nr:hypothetical protein [Candidatus Cloacimonadota bacterium]
MISRIIDLVSRERVISLAQMSALLQISRGALSGMLVLLVRKGYIKEVESPCLGCSGHCSTCLAKEGERYFSLN